MKRFIYISSVLILLFAACKKKDPIELNEDPVFSFTGKLNGNPVSYFSGTNGYYMSSSYQTDTSNVREFSGTLKLFGCNLPCNNSVRLRIRDYRNASYLTNPDTSIAPGYYAYSKPSGAAAAYSTTFIAQFSGGSPQSSLWTFSDGSTATPSVIVKTFPRNGQYNTCLSYTSTSLCTSSICNTIYLGQTGDGVRVNISSTTFSSTAVSFTALATAGTPPFSYSWDFGDGNTSSLQAPTHVYAANGVYAVLLTITDSKGNTGTANKNVATALPGSCAVNYTYSTQPLANPLNLANVILEWTDSNGITYTSENNSQPASSGFQIKSVEEYKLNENGQRTKKITVSANCILYNGASTVLLEDAELIFAIAYP